MELRRTPDGGARAGGRLPSPVWALTALAGGGAVALFVTSVARQSPADFGFHLPWPALIPLFALAEIVVVHLHVRRSAHTVALAEVPLVLGMLFANPAGVVGARLIGSAAALTLHRRQPLLKLVFNLAVFTLDTEVALVVFHRLTEGAAGWTLSLWTAALAACAASFVVSALFVCGAIALSGGGVNALRRLPAMMGLSLPATCLNTVVALGGARLISDDPLAALALIVPVGALAATYRGYIGERDKHERMRMLYAASRALDRSRGVGDIIGALLNQAREMFGAEVAELVLLPADSTGTATRHVLGPGDDAQVVEQPLPTADALPLAHGRRARLTTRARRRTTRVADRSVRDAMVAPVHGEGGVFGTLTVANRRGDVATFTRQDLAAFEAFAQQASMSIENGRLELELETLAYRDSLTGLANRALIVERLQVALAGATGSRFAVLFIDLDDFKLVNDGLGHAAGDRLLAAVAGRLRSCLRPSDLAARLGGDEFAILVTDLSDEGVPARIAERIVAALDAPFVVDGGHASIHASIGIVLSGPATCDAGDVLSRADVAMYHAKARGKGRYEIFEPAMQAEVVERHQLKADLERAIAEETLAVHYQPIIDLASGGVLGAEALVRWTHPTRGPVAPSEFIPLAEETGLIVSLGWHVLERTCRDLAAWRVRHPLLVASVNVSPRQLQTPGFAAQVAVLLAEVGLEPQSLMLEVTETAMVDDERSRAALLKLRGLGVRIAVDDFGTGYSSLAALRELPVDVLKIAKPFVDAIEEGPTDQAFAAAIVRMGETLGLDLIAEGIERDGQLEQLRRLGCGLGQGFRFSPAVETSVLLELVGRPGVAVPRPRLLGTGA